MLGPSDMPEKLYGIVLSACISGRSQPIGKSEQVTQILFGEIFQILKKEEKWSFVRTQWDGYMCWLENNEFVEIDENSFEILAQNSDCVTRDPFTKIVQDKFNFYVPMASSLSLISEKTSLQFNGQCPLDKLYEKTPENAVEIARQYIGSPYQWGGRTHFGIDCSGFTQNVYKLMGVRLSRDSHEQAELGELISFTEEARSGDLAFFDNEDEKIVHVGICIRNNSGLEIIHACGTVRIDALDQQGIYNRNTGKYTHALRLIKRIIQ